MTCLVTLFNDVSKAFDSPVLKKLFEQISHEVNELPDLAEMETEIREVLECLPEVSERIDDLENRIYDIDQALEEFKDTTYEQEAQEKDLKVLTNRVNELELVVFPEPIRIPEKI